MNKVTFTRPVNIFTGFVSWLNASRRYVIHKYRVLTHFDGKALTHWFAKYNVSQLCYFLAITLLIGTAIFSDIANEDLLLVGAIAFIGLFREMWNVFQRVWEHNIGKAIVLVVYAATANFALAFAAVKINLITGVEPAPFTFTLGFTTLIMLPFWLTLSNVFFLLLWLILANLLLFISIPFKLVGIRLPVHWEDTHRAGTTMLLRIVLIPLVIFMLFTITEPYFSQLESISINEQTTQEKNERNDDNVKAKLKDNGEITPTAAVLPTIAASENIAGLDADTKSTQANITEDMTLSEVMGELRKLLEPRKSEAMENSEQVALTLNGKPVNIGASAEEGTAEKQSMFIYSLIADFIFHFESYRYSACKKLPHQHSVIIDDFSMIVITPNEQAEVGYDFTVTECIPVYQVAGNRAQMR